MTGCGCSQCGGARRNWLSVTGARQSDAGPIAAPVPFMEGIADPESLSELPSQYVGRSCASVFVEGRPASSPCALFCGPEDFTKWRAAARELVNLLQGPLAGSVTMLGQSMRVVELSAHVEELHGSTDTEAMAAIVQELACIDEDARGIPSVTPPPPPPPSIGTSPPVTPPGGSWTWPTWPTIPSLIPDWVWWAGGGLLLFMLMQGGSGQPTAIYIGGRKRDE